MSEILDLIESGKIKEAMNTIKKNDRIRSDDIRLGQAFVNSLDQLRKEELPEDVWKADIAEYLLHKVFYMEDREFLKLIFE